MNATLDSRLYQWGVPLERSGGLVKQLVAWIAGHVHRAEGPLSICVMVIGRNWLAMVAEYFWRRSSIGRIAEGTSFGYSSIALEQLACHLRVHRYLSDLESRLQMPTKYLDLHLSWWWSETVARLRGSLSFLVHCRGLLEFRKTSKKSLEMMRKGTRYFSAITYQTKY